METEKTTHLTETPYYEHYSLEKNATASWVEVYILELLPNASNDTKRKIYELLTASQNV